MDLSPILKFPNGGIDAKAANIRKTNDDSQTFVKATTPAKCCKPIPGGQPLLAEDPSGTGD